MPTFRTSALIAAAATIALIAGFFYAYAASVNRGLGALGDRAYLEAMQSINATVRNPVFALSFFGALIALPLAALVHVGRGGRGRWLTASAVLYVLGAFGVTFAFNVPLNDQLAAVDLAGASARELSAARADYEGAWNTWNAVRTIAATLAVGCVAMGALSGERPGSRRMASRSSATADAIG